MDDTEQGFEPVTLKVGGQEVVIDNVEDLLAYAKAGAKNFNKEETLTEEKSIIEQGKLSPETLRLVVDAQNGSKEAIAKLAQNGNIDLLDVDNKMADEHVQSFQETQVSDVDKVVGEIAQDTEHMENFKSVVQILPSDFRGELMKDANMLSHFSRHVKDGLAQEILPLAITEQVKNGGSFMDAYTKTGEALMAKKQEQPAQSQAPAQQKQEREVSERAKKLRDRANNSRGSKGTPQDSADDIWGQSDEDFDDMISSGRITD